MSPAEAASPKRKAAAQPPNKATIPVTAAMLEALGVRNALRKEAAEAAEAAKARAAEAEEVYEQQMKTLQEQERIEKDRAVEGFLAICPNEGNVLQENLPEL